MTCGDIMIDFEPFFNILVERGIPQRQLLQSQIIAPATLQRLRNGQGVRTETINSICNFLRCQPMDIMRYTPDYTDEESTSQPQPKKSSEVDQLRAELEKIAQRLTELEK